MIRKRGAVPVVLMFLGACGGAPGDEAADAGKARIECALEGAEAFAPDCTVEEMSGADGAVLVVGRSDVGYRRLQIATDGRGVVSADGSEPAKVAIVGDRLIEVAIGNDRYRLPANTRSAK
ncbi:hypothetical protein [Sphingopyxis alaskensis]|uniref:hypothetical protein n=1 Tax=Sphingopyxis alaskensis TaxID=117207 RepID=UPI00391CCF29